MGLADLPGFRQRGEGARQRAQRTRAAGPSPKATARRTRPKPSAPSAAAATAPDTELMAERDRLLEKFTIMQTDLGGAFYEMAIRDHVRLDVLTRRAAALQRIDAELAQVERRLELERSDAAGICTSCGSPYGHGMRFCPQCGGAVTATSAVS